MRKRLHLMIIVAIIAGGSLLQSDAYSAKPDSLSIDVCKLTSKGYWSEVRPNLDAVNYRCLKKCKDWEKCVQPLQELDEQGNVLQEFEAIAFAVDGMGGVIRWNIPDPENGVKAGLFLHSGLGGTSEMRSSNPNVWRQMEKDGLRVVDVKWLPGVYDPRIEVVYGWMSRKESLNPPGFVQATRRPAALLSWVHDQVIPSDVPFGTLGSSGGAIATFSAVYWHGLDTIIDYQMLIGGPILWDLNASCQAMHGILPNNGVCEGDPEMACDVDGDCSWNCAYPTMLPRAAVTIDYVTGNPGTCLIGETSHALDESSYSKASVSKDNNFDHRVDFIIGTGDEIADDTLIGVTYPAGKTYVDILAEKNWINLNPGYHGSAIKEGLPNVVGLIRSGLGLVP